MPAPDTQIKFWSEMTNKPIPADNDVLLVGDSSDRPNPKYSTVAQLRAPLQAAINNAQTNLQNLQRYVQDLTNPLSVDSRLESLNSRVVVLENTPSGGGSGGIDLPDSVRVFAGDSQVTEIQLDNLTYQSFLLYYDDDSTTFASDYALTDDVDTAKLLYISFQQGADSPFDFNLYDRLGNLLLNIPTTYPTAGTVWVLTPAADGLSYSYNEEVIGVFGQYPIKVQQVSAIARRVSLASDFIESSDSIDVTSQSAGTPYPLKFKLKPDLLKPAPNSPIQMQSEDGVSDYPQVIDVSRAGKYNDGVMSQGDWRKLNIAGNISIASSTLFNTAATILGNDKIELTITPFAASALRNGYMQKENYAKINGGIAVQSSDNSITVTKQTDTASELVYDLKVGSGLNQRITPIRTFYVSGATQTVTLNAGTYMYLVDVEGSGIVDTVELINTATNASGGVKIALYNQSVFMVNPNVIPSLNKIVEFPFIAFNSATQQPYFKRLTTPVSVNGFINVSGLKALYYIMLSVTGSSARSILGRVLQMQSGMNLVCSGYSPTIYDDSNTPPDTFPENSFTQNLVPQNGQTYNQPYIKIW